MQPAAAVLLCGIKQNGSLCCPFRANNGGVIFKSQGVAPG